MKFTHKSRACFLNQQQNNDSRCLRLLNDGTEYLRKSHIRFI